jgi:hypothetical protein
VACCCIPAAADRLEGTAAAEKFLERVVLAALRPGRGPDVYHLLQRLFAALPNPAPRARVTESMDSARLPLAP